MITATLTKTSGVMTAIFSFGVVFVVVLLALAIKFKKPTPFQYTVFRIVLALAAAGVAAFIPGLIEVELHHWIKTGGAMAIFVIIYFFSPAGLVMSEQEPNPTTWFQIVLVSQTDNRVELKTTNLPLSDIKQNSDYIKFMEIVSQLTNQRFDQNKVKIFRMKDENQLLLGGSLSAVDHGNLGMIVIPVDVIDGLGGDHVAFTKILSQVPVPPRQRG